MHEGHRERLRATFIEQDGINSFHDHQALELLLTFSLPRIDTNPIAHILLDRYGSLKEVLNASVHDLVKVPGIGIKTAVLLKLTGELSNRMAVQEVKINKIKSSADAMLYCKPLFKNCKNEVAIIVLLNKAREVIHTEKISTGTLTRSSLHPRQVAECAIRHGAYSVILAHNHPSGKLTPSAEDVEVTKRVINALAAMEINFNDHIIVSENDAYSCLQDCCLSSLEELEQNQQTVSKEA
ncbi:MAG: DNA repair protein RadC [Clostridia bacterium]|nr:DNA repair protein RadC [Clostridia bacterium]